MREIRKIYLEGMMQTSVIGFPRIGTLRELKDFKKNTLEHTKRGRN